MVLLAFLNLVVFRFLTVSSDEAHVSREEQEGGATVDAGEEIEEDRYEDDEDGHSRLRLLVEGCSSCVSLLSSTAEEHSPITPERSNLPEPSRLQALFSCTCCDMDVYSSASQSHHEQSSGHSNPVFYSTISY